MTLTHHPKRLTRLYTSTCRRMLAARQLPPSNGSHCRQKASIAGYHLLASRDAPSPSCSAMGLHILSVAMRWGPLSTPKCAIEVIDGSFRVRGGSRIELGLISRPHGAPTSLAFPHWSGHELHSSPIERSRYGTMQHVCSGTSTQSGAASKRHACGLDVARALGSVPSAAKRGSLRRKIARVRIPLSVRCRISLLGPQMPLERWN